MRIRIQPVGLCCLITTLLSTTTALAQSHVALHTFSVAKNFSAPLAQGPDGTLYGVSALGGVSGPPGSGTVFKLQPDGSGFSIIYSFTNGSDGAGPAAGLVLSGGTLYGTAENGGSGGHGTVFKINTDGSGFATIYSFTAYTSGTNSDGASPLGRLVLAGNTLYGTASAGGVANGFGTIFKVNTDGSGFTNLHTFGLLGVSDPAFPMAGLVLSGSTLYGTTEAGGGSGAGGTVFKIDTNGAGFLAVHTFSPAPSGTNTDGAHPKAGLVLSGGTLYGTTSAAGKGYGTVFSLNIGDSSFTNIYSFTNGADGSTPVADLAISGGTLYGTASAAGTNFPGWGTIFTVNTSGTGFSNLYEFAQGTSGTSPVAGLLLSGSTLYGTTPHTSGANGGTIFKLDTGGTGFTVLANGSDGAQPQSGLVLSGGSFYGTTSAGGVSGAGIVFKVGTNGTGFTTLHAFPAAVYAPGISGNFYTNSDGATPLGTLALSGGVLYGTTESGGTYGVGTVFRLNTDGTAFTNLYNFTDGPDGAQPSAGLVLSGNALYGTASGGLNGATIFKINTDGTGFSNLYEFSVLVNGTNNDGNAPLSGLALAGDTLYGAAYYGGPGGAGTLFKINTNGMGFTNLYSFNTPARDSSNSLDGSNPDGILVLSGTTLYGVTQFGGIVQGTRLGSGVGTVFKLNTDGTGFLKLHTFTNTFDGSSPKAGLVLSGSTLYGTASLSGNGLSGTVFQLDISGTGFTTLHTFPSQQQGTPVGDLLLIGNTVYGTSEFGAPVSASALAGAGTVFAVTPTATPGIQFTASPTNGVPPTTVQFTSPGVDDKGNPIISWFWNFGDGSTNTTQNPAHPYTNNSPFFPSLTAVNNNGATIAGSGPAILITYPTSIQNGGFEAGTFTNWILGGVSGRAISTSTNYQHSGTYGAELGASGDFGSIAEIIDTTPGANYLISFWLRDRVGGTPSAFKVIWGGQVLLNQTNLPVFGWTNIQFSVPAGAATETLEFDYLYNTSFFGLDDVSVTRISSSQPVITQVNLSGTNLVVDGGGGGSGQTYYLLMGTNLTEPLTNWIPVASNTLSSDGNFTLTATNAVLPGIPQRYFILMTP